MMALICVALSGLSWRFNWRALLSVFKNSVMVCLPLRGQSVVIVERVYRGDLTATRGAQ